MKAFTKLTTLNLAKTKITDKVLKDIATLKDLMTTFKLAGEMGAGVSRGDLEAREALLRAGVEARHGRAPGGRVRQIRS